MCFGILLDAESEGIHTETLSSFLASSLNVELVNIILKGIKKFMMIHYKLKIHTETAMEKLVVDQFFYMDFSREIYFNNLIKE